MAPSGQTQKPHLECHVLTQDLDLLLLPLLLLQLLLTALPLHANNVQGQHADDSRHMHIPGAKPTSPGTSHRLLPVQENDLHRAAIGLDWLAVQELLFACSFFSSMARCSTTEGQCMHRCQQLHALF